MNFQIVDVVTGKVMETGFQTRQDAKVKRNELNTKYFNEAAHDVMLRFVVSRSPNHIRGESVRLGNREIEAAKRCWPSLRKGT